jgi:hypothetical protein
MMKSAGTKETIFFIKMFLAAVVMITGCKQKTKTGSRNAGEHWAEVKMQGVGMIYIDEVPCSSVLSEVDSGKGETEFHCYRVGFVDSLPAKAKDKKELDKGKYYQYDMHKDWVALIDGDSIRPVFYQPMIKKEMNKEESILVFEITKDKQADTLVYNDSYGLWGRRVIIKNK